MAIYQSLEISLTCNQLSKDEEASTPDAEVTREDQDKINAFSRLHNREKKYEEELERKQVIQSRQNLHFARRTNEMSPRKRKKTSKRSQQSSS